MAFDFTAVHYREREPFDVMDHGSSPDGLERLACAHRPRANV